jgi:hypothetical protein
MFQRPSFESCSISDTISDQRVERQLLAGHGLFEQRAQAMRDAGKDQPLLDQPGQVDLFFLASPDPGGPTTAMSRAKIEPATDPPAKQDQSSPAAALRTSGTSWPRQTLCCRCDEAFPERVNEKIWNDRVSRLYLRAGAVPRYPGDAHRQSGAPIVQ